MIKGPGTSFQPSELTQNLLEMFVINIYDNICYALIFMTNTYDKYCYALIFDQVISL